MSFYSKADRQHAILNMIIFFCGLLKWVMKFGRDLGSWLHMQPALFDSEILLAFLHECSLFSNAICGSVTSFIKEFKANGQHKSHSTFPDCIYQKRVV